MKLAARLARMFGRRRVALQDFDGEVTIRWAKRNAFGLSCYRFPYGVRPCFLKEDGTVAQPNWVKLWKYDEC